MSLSAVIAQRLGQEVRRLSPLSGGCIDDVFRAELATGESVVVKSGDAGSGLDLEGYMLGYLREHSALPVPEVLFADETLLIMTHLPAGGGLNASAETHAADLVAALHDVTAGQFGLERDTVIGGLHQPNPPSQSWVSFFRDHRLLFMAREGVAARRLPGRVMHRIDQFTARLDGWIGEPPRPSLIHGDMWTGNVLAYGGRISGFIDPAIYYADPEIELAFTTMFGTFGDPFFGRYRELRPMKPGFFEERRDIYNLYPLLVHVRLFGGHYVSGVERTLSKFGC